MQSSEQQYFSQNPPGPGPPPTGQGGHNGYTYNNDTHFSSVLSEMPPNVNHLLPFQNVNFRPSETCPRNFIIFDRTDNRSQIMYHPGLAQKSCFPAGLNIGPPWLLQDNLRTNEVLFSSSFIKEDSDDIEALLSLEEENEEEEEEEEHEDEDVSTARTCNYGSDSDDSCSSKPRKSSKLLPTSSPHRSSTGTGKSRKREKMRKMVKALRGMVPDSNNMNSVDVLDVLDEAVKYLKSLKVEVQKVGVGNSKN